MNLKPGIRNRRPVWVATGFLVLLLTGCFEWPNAEKFRGSLRCGMSREEVANLAREFDANDIRCPEPLANAPDRCAIVSRRTFFELVFTEKGLTAVVRGRYTGLYGLEFDKEERLCGP